MTIEYYEGLVLKEEQIKKTREYEKARTGNVVSISLGSCIGAFFLAVGIALLCSGDPETQYGGAACLALVGLVFVIVSPIVYCCCLREKELLREKDSYICYEAELTDVDLSVSGGGRYSPARLNLLADALFRTAGGTLIQKKIRYTSSSGAVSAEKLTNQKILVAFNEKTGTLLTFEEELKKLDNDEW